MTKTSRRFELPKIRASVDEGVRTSKDLTLRDSIEMKTQKGITRNSDYMFDPGSSFLYQTVDL